MGDVAVHEAKTTAATAIAVGRVGNKEPGTHERCFRVKRKLSANLVNTLDLAPTITRLLQPTLHERREQSTGV